MYYLKLFLSYSLLGFIMESTLFKINQSKKYSGIFYGPMTIVYGVGILTIEFLNNYLFKKLKTNKIIKYLIEFIILTISLSLVEYLSGNIIKLLFDFDMWDYSNNFLHFGKYICLQNSIIWGVLGTMYIHIFKPFTDKLLNTITNKEVYIFLTIFIIDLLMVLITKL